MAEKELEQTQKALAELVKTEYQAIAAYDEALGETDDSKLRRQYSRFRNDHEKQARALNNRLAELGGEPVEYDGAKFGRAKAGLFAKIAGMFGDAASLGGMVKGAEDGIRIYLDHLDEIHDTRALSIIRRNLESKQQEVRWLEEQAQREKEDEGPDLGEKARAAAADLSKKQEKVVKDVQEQIQEAAKPQRTGFLGLPVWILLAVGAVAAFFFMRRQEEPDFSDEAFQYETADFGSPSDSGNTSFGSPSDSGNTAGSGYHGISEGGNDGGSDGGSNTV